MARGNGDSTIHHDQFATGPKSATFISNISVPTTTNHIPLPLLHQAGAPVNGSA
jgi:hypothetical protein